MSYLKLQVNEYQTPTGKHQVSIVPNPEFFGSYHSMGGYKIWDKMPNVLAKLKSLGFTNESRDLCMKDFGFRLTYSTKSEAKRVAEVYKSILKGLQVTELA